MWENKTHVFETISTFLEYVWDMKAPFSLLLSVCLPLGEKDPLPG